MKYKLVNNRMTGELDGVHKIMEGKMICIPLEPANKDYQEYLQWLDEGNTPEEAE